MCNSNFGGKECGLGVSSIRDVEIERDGVSITTQAKLYCGESTLVPDQLDIVASRGKLDPITLECDCAPISNIDNTGRSGTVIERFTRDACECAEVQNLDTQEVVMCADNGECVERDFPYGFCELDLDDFENDPLSEPYEQFTVFSDDEVLMQVTDDVYLIFDYAYPTSSPTAHPTTPTNSPTSAPSYILLYFSDAGLVDGNSGTSPTICIAAASPSCLAPSIYQFKSTVPSPVTSLPYPTSSPVRGPNNQHIGMWGSIINTFLPLTLAQAGLDEYSSFWSGTFYSGYTQSDRTCLEWTSNSASELTISGSTGSAGFNWIGNNLASCSQLLPILCSCEIPY
jgi:hypothetical protein